VEQPVGFRAQPVRHGAQAGLPGGNEAAVSGTASVAADAPQRLPARCTAVPNTRRAAEAATPELIGTPPSGRLDAGSAAPAAAAQAEHAQAGAALSLACASEGGGARAAPYASAPDPAPALVSASASPFAAAARAAAPGWDSAAPGALGAAAGRPESARAAGAGGGLRGASEGLAAALVEQTLLAMPRRPDAVTHIRCASAAAPAAPEAVADKPQGRVATARSALRAPLAPQERGRGSRGA